MFFAPESRRFTRPRPLPPRRFCRGRAGFVVAAALLTGAVGCKADAGSACAAGTLTAVAVDAQTPSRTYVALTSVAGAAYGIVDASNLSTLWSATDDGRPLGLFAPSAGGVLVANGGAAARRIDASGALLWSVGYGDVIGVLAALTDTDDLVVVDPQSVRRYGSEGTPVWDEALPASITGVSALVADRQGGVWLVGTFAGGLSPWVAAAPSSTGVQPSGPFVIHLDGQGDEIGGGAWNLPALALHQAAEAIDASGAPMLVVTGGGSEVVAPAFGLPAATGEVAIAAAFGSSGQILWSRTIASAPDLRADAEGNLLALTGSTGTLSVDRWDSDGNPGPSVGFVVDAKNRVGLRWAGTPVAGGLVVGGEEIVAADGEEDSLCNGRHFLVQITTDPLAIEALPSRLP
jgi:hypothetical protein